MDKIMELSAKALASPAVRQMLLNAKRWGFVGTAGYLLLVAVLRKRRLRQLEKKHNYRSRKDLAKMTDDEAFQIIKSTVQQEFPFTFLIALQFALFRVSFHPSRATYGGREEY